MRVEPDDGKEDLERLEAKIDRLASEVAAIRRHFMWERVLGIVKTLLIAVPLVWGVIVLYPIATKLYVQTQDIINQTNSILKYAPH